MKRLQLTTVALFWLSAAVCAQSGICFAAATSPGSDQYSALVPTAPGASEHIVQNANECAPDQAEAVWGRNSALLGYSCYDNPNGL